MPLGEGVGGAGQILTEKVVVLTKGQVLGKVNHQTMMDEMVLTCQTQCFDLRLQRDTENGVCVKKSLALLANLFIFLASYRGKCCPKSSDCQFVPG